MAGEAEIITWRIRATSALAVLQDGEFRVRAASPFPELADVQQTAKMMPAATTDRAVRQKDGFLRGMMLYYDAELVNTD